MIDWRNNERLYTIEDISNGNESAFAQFYRHHYPVIAAKILYILKNKEQTEEIVQDVFSKIWLQRDTLTCIENIDAYLHTLARNSCLNQLKANVRKQNFERQFVDQETLEDKLVVEDNHDSHYYALLDQAIERLPDQQRKVYVLSRIDRKKYLDIAIELEISKETVKKYLQYATQSIKNYLSIHKDSIISIISLFYFF